MIDLAKLLTEITTDPAALGYAPFVASGDDASVAALLNTVGTATITRPTLSREDLFIALLPAASTFSGATASVKAKWDWIFNVLKGVTTLDSASINFIATSLVTDTLIPQANVDAFLTRKCSRAEIVLGYGVAVSINDVAKALRP